MLSLLLAVVVHHAPVYHHAPALHRQAPVGPAQDYLNRTYKLDHAGQLDRAIDMAEFALTKLPHTPKAKADRHMAAMIYKELGHLHEARTLGKKKLPHDRLAKELNASSAAFKRSLQLEPNPALQHHLDELGERIII